MTYFPRLLGQGVWKSLVKHRKTTSKVSSKYWSKVPAEQTPCYWVLYGCKKKSQKVQLSMSLCASASTLYFGKFWYWCIILDHLPNVVYIYTQYTKLSRQTKYWSDANTCIGIDTIDMWIVAPTCSPNTVHTGKSTFTFTINMMLKTNIQIDSCLKKQISHIGLLAHTKCKAIS